MSQAETQKQSHQPLSHQQLLNVFVGTWKTEGQQHEGFVGAAATIIAQETYEWLTGELFLVHRFEGRVGDNQVACLEVIGYDIVSRSHPIHTFYNNGTSNQWQLSESGGVWTINGEWQMADQATEVRCTIFFSDDGNTMISNWEYLNDMSNWQTFWDVKATKTAARGEQ